MRDFRTPLWVIAVSVLTLISCGEREVTVEFYPSLESYEVPTIDTAQIYMDSAIAYLKKYEAFAATPYIDVNGSRTIGYGHHMRGKENYKSISEKTADSLLREDLNERIVLVTNKHSSTGNRALAIALLVYNIGSGNYMKSHLKTLVDAGRTIDKEILAYCHYTQNGVVYKSKKLLQRRKFELKIYNSGLVK